jgi:hypothetical protein
MRKEAKIAFIKVHLGLDDATIRQLGVGPLMVQIAVKKGMEGVGKCDADSGDTSQYTGDLEKDLKIKK